MSLTLETKVSEYFRITPAQKIALKKLGIENIQDLLYHFPVRYGDTAVAKSIDSLQAGDSAVIFGKISGLKASKGFKTKVTMADGYVEDETGRIHCVWFNQPYLAKISFVSVIKETIETPLPDLQEPLKSEVSLSPSIPHKKTGLL
jgi:ATP-dependent DNA helicase RecG